MLNLGKFFGIFFGKFRQSSPGKVDTRVRILEIITELVELRKELGESTAVLRESTALSEESIVVLGESIAIPGESSVERTRKFIEILNTLENLARMNEDEIGLAALSHFRDIGKNITEVH